MSRATLIDERPEDNEATDQLEQDTLETPLEEEPTQEELGLPEKYQGKSVEDLVQMHQELEKFSGKQSTEVGELRKVVDNYIQTQTQLSEQAPQQQQEQDEEVDFFVDPASAVNRAIDNHPKIREAQAYTEQYKKQATMAQLQQQHPDMEAILQDAKFAEWIKGSKVRTQLFVQADQMYDYDAANELFSLWKERSQAVQQTAQAEKQARKSAVKTANTGNARGTAEGSRKKTYRRADLINLMKTDPDRYMALQPEIMAAYAEKRVK
tara:strand:+ start:3668 stop:4465 length:798 start_codon:yes stop_codon:yes gene_type:complete